MINKNLQDRLNDLTEWIPKRHPKYKEAHKLFLELDKRPKKEWHTVVLDESKKSNKYKV